MIKSVLYQPTMLKHSDILFCHIRTLLLQIPKRTIIITEDFRSESQKARDKLQNVLDISKHKALNVVESCKKLFDTPSSCISENYKICIKHKINKETVLKYPFLLCDSNLQKKLTVLQKIPIPLNSLIPLTQFTLIQLKFFMNFKETDVVHKINYLCDTFNMNAEEVCNNIASKPFIFTKSVSEIEALLKLLYGSGLTIEDILKDLWVLKNSENHVRKRLEFLKYHNVKNIKTWMIRCLEESLYKKIQKETDNREVLGDNSLVEYLSEKLNCSESLVESIIRKYPQFRKMNLPKLNKMIDLLCSAGYSEFQICRCPKILFHKTSTIEQRLKELSKMGVKPEALYVLTKSEMQYQSHIISLKKAKILKVV